MQRFFGYYLHELQDECIPLLFSLFAGSGSSTMRAIHEKYSRVQVLPKLSNYSINVVCAANQYMSVALLSPRGTIDNVLAV